MIVNDIDNKILEIDDEDIAYDINEIGSIGTYLEAKSINDKHVIKKLEENGFELSYEEEILHGISHDEIGDCVQSRFEHLLLSLMNTVVVVGDLSKIENDHHKDYRCWNKFYINRKFSYYEWTRWIASCEDLASLYPNIGLILMCKFNRDLNLIAKIMNNILPQLKFDSKGYKIYIGLDQINKIL